MRTGSGSNKTCLGDGFPREVTPAASARLRAVYLAGMTRNMVRLFALSALLLISSALAQTSQAQEAVQERVEIGESGEAYLKSLRLRGINADAVYYDPSAPAPKLDTAQLPDKRPDQSDSDSGKDVGFSTAQWTVGLIAAALLAIIGYVIHRFGGGLPVSLKRDAENHETGRTRRVAETPAWAEKLSSFDEILRIQDRQQALILLTQKVLAATVAAHGILMQRSWTARDALRHIPGAPEQLATLRDLVMRAEGVQFGDRTVSEEEFLRHADQCRQFMGPATA
ncbi:DUF4129 domain-containing protein [Rhodobacterales bacterium]|nr:DUF4129 domain-containing protein [Rhodobacterales bacterium]